MLNFRKNWRMTEMQLKIFFENINVMSNTVIDWEAE